MYISQTGERSCSDKHFAVKILQQKETLFDI